MEKGISESKVFFITMTKGIMSKPYPIMEMRWARMYDIPMIGVMDKSTAGGKDFIYDELEAAPEDLKGLLKDVEYIPYRTKGYEQGPMMVEIMRRGNLKPPAAGGSDTAVVVEPDDVGELTELLTAAKLLKHAAAIEKAGYAEPDDLRAAEDEELLEVGMRKPEIKRLRKYLSDAANLKRRQTCRGTRTRRASRRSKRSRTS